MAVPRIAETPTYIAGLAATAHWFTVSVLSEFLIWDVEGARTGKNTCEPCRAFGHVLNFSHNGSIGQQIGKKKRRTW